MQQHHWRAATALAAVLALAPISRAAAQDAGSTIELDLGKGRLVHLRAPAAGVFIGDPKIADIQVRSPSLVYVIGKGLGETSLMAVDDHDATIANIDVQVGLDMAGLRRDLKHFLPDADIQATTVKNAIALEGTVASPGQEETAKLIAGRYVGNPDKDVINLMRLDAPNQVNLRVRIVEVSRQVIKSFGVNWTMTGANGAFRFGGTTLSGTGGTGANGASQLTLGLHNRYIDLNAALDALDSLGLTKTLAEPNLTAVSGKPAEFLAGGQFPIPTAQTLGVTTITFQNYGVSLSSVATITDDGRIVLTVRPEVSQLTTAGSVTYNGQLVPGLTTRRAETTVELASGQSFAIAGLLQNNVTHSLEKVPGLGSLGILGALFRSDNFERDESELIIIVTPYIVKPVSHALAGPDDGYMAPTDTNRIAHGADYTRAPRTGLKVGGEVQLVTPVAAARVASLPPAAPSPVAEAPPPPIVVPPPPPVVAPPPMASPASRPAAPSQPAASNPGETLSGPVKVGAP